MTRIAAFLGIAASVACGPSVADETPMDLPSCDPWQDVCTLSMSPDFARSIAVDLPAASMSEAETPTHHGGMACALGRYLVLGTFGSADQLCVLEDPVDALEDVDVTQCERCDDQAIGCWTSTVYFGLWGDPPDAFVGRALAAKTSDGELYRIRVLHDDAASEPAQLTIEYEGVR